MTKLKSIIKDISRSLIGLNRNNHKHDLSKDMITDIGYYKPIETKQLLRRSFSLFIQGDGIEIGALHQPLSLDGLPIANVRYVDRLPVEQLQMHYPELSNYKFAPVDVIDDGEVLHRFMNNSLDFIIANHFIEHARNPLGTIRAWLQKLKPGGVIYLAIPDKRFTFDVDRQLTQLEHLVKDDQAGNIDLKTRDHEHYVEYTKLVDKLSGDALQNRVCWLIETDYSIHFHTFTPTSFQELLEYAKIQLNLPFETVAFASTLPGSEEFLVLLKRQPLDAAR